MKQFRDGHCVELLRIDDNKSRSQGRSESNQDKQLDSPLEVSVLSKEART